MYRLAVLALLAFGALVAAPASAPVGASYVYSDSMEPAIGTSDGFVHVPAGDIKPGDIVVFEGGPGKDGVTAHRVVRETERGFVTKGDNNDVSDQEAGYPYVQRSEVRGEVLTYGGEPVVLPNLGVLISAVRANQALLLIGIVGIFLIGRDGSARERARKVTDSDEIVRFVVGVTALALVVMSLLGGTTAQVAFAVGGDASERRTIPANTAATETVTLNGGGQGALTAPSVVAHGEATVVSSERNGTALDVTLSVPPQRTGVYQVPLSIHHFPAVLPRGALFALHRIHAALAAVVTAAVVVFPIGIVGWAFLGRGVPLHSGRNRGFARWFR